MIIYGVALLSVSLIFGMLIGEALGVMLGVDANVGGVGIAMLFLVFASNSASFRTLTEGAAGGHQILERHVHPDRGGNGRPTECCCRRRRRHAGACRRNSGGPRQFCSGSCYQPLRQQ